MNTESEMANDLNIYVDGKYYGLAIASAREVALHEDYAEYTLHEACIRFGFPGLDHLTEAMLKTGRDPTIVMVSVRDDNKY